MILAGGALWRVTSKAANQFGANSPVDQPSFPDVVGEEVVSVEVESASKLDALKLMTLRNLRAPGPTIVSWESSFKRIRGFLLRV